MNSIYVALDVEATGMDPGRDEIIEVAAIKFRNNQVVGRWESLVRPSRPIPFNIANLTGISNDDVRDAPRFAAVAPQLYEFVDNYPIVGQSPEFDIQMLRGAGLPLRNPQYDTFQLATILIPDLPAYNLGTIADRLGVNIPNQHRAMADVETTMQVFVRLRQLLEEYDPATLDRLALFSRTARSPLSRLFTEVRRDILEQEDGVEDNNVFSQLLSQSSGSGAAGPEFMFMLQRERPERLAATGESSWCDSAQLRSWTEPGSLLEQTFPGFEHREQQSDMLTAVNETFNKSEHLLVEAGTGTGKSLAYLLPAIIHAVQSGEPVVISTDTIALQDQLYRKDLPDLRRALQKMAKDYPELAEVADFKASVLKGRSNYLCLRRWFLAQREGADAPEEARLHSKILTWVQQTETGDRAELHLAPDEQEHWTKLAEDEGSCVPGRCVFHQRNQCFLFRARHEAESAHVVVVNHSLLLSDMLASNTVLPPYRHLIIDEAHNLEEEATNQLGFGITRGRLQEIVNRAIHRDDTGVHGAVGTLFSAVQTLGTPAGKKIAGDLQSRIQSIEQTASDSRSMLDSFFDHLIEFMENYQDSDRGGYDRRLRMTRAVRHDPSWSETELRWEDASQRVRKLLRQIRDVVKMVEPLSEDELSGYDDLLTEFDVILRFGDELLENAVRAISEPDDQTVYWLTRNARTGDISIQAAPLHVGPVLQEQLFSRCDTVVLTSATMTIDGSFEFIRTRLGLEHANELRVSSPFDYRSSTLVYVAEDVPEPGQQGHQKEMHATLKDLCLASRGRAMILFTSHSALQNAYRALKRPLEAEGILVLGQRLDGSPRQLVERLKSHNETVLLGTNSFWEGVDIVGDALRLLVITKLPFSVPSDPVFAARSELFEDPFISYAVPQAVLRFKQGFGRLIRSSADTGVCAVLDRRVASRRYGTLFVDSLPDCTVERGPASALPARTGTWLRERDVVR